MAAIVCFNGDVVVQKLYKGLSWIPEFHVTIPQNVTKITILTVGPEYIVPGQDDWQNPSDEDLVFEGGSIELPDLPDPTITNNTKTVGISIPGVQLSVTFSRTKKAAERHIAFHRSNASIRVDLTHLPAASAMLKRRTLVKQLQQEEFALANCVQSLDASRSDAAHYRKQVLEATEMLEFIEKSLLEQEDDERIIRRRVEDLRQQLS